MKETVRKKSVMLLVCMALLLYCHSAAAQSACPNIDFYQGTHAGWQPVYGTRTACCPNSGAGTVHSVITDTSLYDANSCYRLRCTPPDGAFTARVGKGGSYGNPLAQKLSYTLTVTAQHPMLIYRLVAVMLKGADDLGKTNVASVAVRITDQNSNLINGPCRGDTLYADSASTGQQVSLSKCGMAQWLPWNAVAVDLSAYIGQSVTIEFFTTDCWSGAHAGYAYVTAACTTPDAEILFCKNAASASITAPALFKSYAWSTGETTPAISVANPVHGAIYTCMVTAYNGCTATFQYRLAEGNVLAAGFTDERGPNCMERLFHDTTKLFTTDTVQSWQWHFDDPASGPGNYATSQHPSHIFSHAGTYDVSLKVQLSSGCFDTIMRSISVSNEGMADFTATSACPDSLLVFTDASTEGVFNSWTWYVADTVLSGREAGYAFPESGSYRVQLVVRSADGCIDTAVKDITVYTRPAAAFTSNTQQEGEINPWCYFNNESHNAVSYLWDFGNGAGSTEENPRYQYRGQNGRYTIHLTAISKHGCIDTAIRTIILGEDYMIPTAFTPNGDGLNDVFRLLMSRTPLKVLYCHIYDRWGTQVWTAQGIDAFAGWDGTYNGQPAQIGTYKYVISVIIEGETKLFKGDVLLIR